MPHINDFRAMGRIEKLMAGDIRNELYNKTSHIYDNDSYFAESTGFNNTSKTIPSPGVEFFFLQRCGFDSMEDHFYRYRRNTLGKKS